MGFPAGWVTDLILPNTDPRPDRIGRSHALKMLGNAVVPQCADVIGRWALELAERQTAA